MIDKEKQAQSHVIAITPAASGKEKGLENYL